MGLVVIPIYFLPLGAVSIYTHPMLAAKGFKGNYDFELASPILIVHEISNVLSLNVYFSSSYLTSSSSFL